MKQVKQSLMMIALGLVLATGSSQAADMTQVGMGASHSWNGIGAVVPTGVPSTQIDYKGAVTTFQTMFPGIELTSLSYEGKHNPYYELEGYVAGQKVEMKVRASGELMSTEVEMITSKKYGDMVNGGQFNDNHKGTMMYGEKHSKIARLKGKAFDVNTIIIPELAETKAQERIGGEFQVMEWSVEKEYGRLVYDLDMIDGSGKKADVEVDALTGEVLRVKVKQSRY